MKKNSDCDEKMKDLLKLGEKIWANSFYEPSYNNFFYFNDNAKADEITNIGMVFVMDIIENIKI